MYQYIIPTTLIIILPTWVFFLTKKDIIKFINKDKLHKHWMKKFDELSELQELVNRLKRHSEIKDDVKTWEKKLHGAVILLSFEWKDKEFLKKKLDTFDFQSLKNELILKWGKFYQKN